MQSSYANGGEDALGLKRIKKMLLEYMYVAIWTLKQTNIQIVYLVEALGGTVLLYTHTV